LRGGGTGAVSAFAGWLYLVNLKRAVEEFDLKEARQWTNMGSALAAVGGGVNSGLMAFKGIAPNAYEASKQSVYKQFGFAREGDLVERLAGKFATRLFGYGGAFFSFVTDGLKSKEQFSEGDTDAGLFYAGSAVSIGIGGTALTYGMTMTAGTIALGLTPVGWVVLGIALVGASILLAYSAESAKDNAIEKWLDAGTFGRHERPDSPTYASLDEELNAMGYAMHAPKVIDTDWEDRFGWPDYKAEVSISLPGYDGAESQLRVHTNGKHLGAYVKSNTTGGVAELRHYLPKDGKAERVAFEIRYRPDRNFDKDYVLHVIVPEPEQSDSDEPSLSGP
jgi:hypothetical protein